ncbi:MAG: hypothetical protein C4541_11280 [Candidatus Auribacter fodinae]|jgi:hypothetical protein|uniref:IPT/TIG domain-containing protein n=1 Tax=Candidatus Auribacter fodinae TaxID=2093366 RepID=A0A3A4QS84_9BACT|nr:MAG: hypothetical protein C4541_11280 [Candidatus Auribacter fodinae]
MIKRFLCISTLLLSFIYCSIAGAANRGLYINLDAVNDTANRPESASSLFSFIQAPFNDPSGTFNELLFELNSQDSFTLLSSNASTQRAILSQLHDSDKNAACVVDVSSWIQPELHGEALLFLATILNFNSGAEDSTETFDTIYIDAKVSTDNWAQYVVLLQSIRSQIDSFNQRTPYPISLSIILRSNDYAQTIPDYRPIDLADSVIFSAESRILFYLKKFFALEINYAETIGKPFSFMVTARNTNTVDTFWGFTDNPLAYFNEVVFTGLSSAAEDSDDASGLAEYLSKFSRFSSIIIDGYTLNNGYQQLAVSNQADTSEQWVTVLPGTGSNGELDYVDQTDPTFYDPYRPTFKRYTQEAIYIYIDFDSTGVFYTLQFDDDSPVHEFSNDGFIRSNNHNGIMEPLEKGQFRITIHSALIRDIFLHDYLYPTPSKQLSDLDLRLQIVDPPEGMVFSEDPASSALNSSGGYDILLDQPMTFTFITGKINPAQLHVPLTFKLFNVPISSIEQRQELVFNSDDPVNTAEKQYFDFDDAPFGKVSAISPVYNIINDVTIISGDTLTVEGWAFDDDDALKIGLYYTESDNDIEAETTLTRVSNPITGAIPYFGTAYDAGFQLDWDNDSYRGLYDIKVRLTDGPGTARHTINLAAEQIFWNRPPDLTMLAELQSMSTDPSSAAEPVPDYIVITAVAQDIDVNVALGAYLSAVEIVLLDSSDHVVKSELITNNVITDPVIDIQRVWPNFFNTDIYTLKATAYDSYGLTRTVQYDNLEIMRVVPVISKITPRLGTSHENNVISISGFHLLFIDEAKFGSTTAQILSSNAAGTDLQIKLPGFLNSGYYESRYVDVTLTMSDTSESDTHEDGYRIIPGNLKADEGVSASSVGSVNTMQFNDILGQLYVLANSAVEVYEETTHPVYPEKPSLSYIKTKEFFVSAGAKDIDISEDGSSLFVVYSADDVVDIFDLENDGNLISSVALNTSMDLTLNSVVYLMHDTVLAGSEGTESALLKVSLGTTSSVQALIPPSGGLHVYESIEVIASDNQSTAYILCKDSDNTSAPFDVYLYDAHTATLTHLDSIQFSQSFNILDHLGSLSIATNYNGTEFMLYTNRYAELFDRTGMSITYTQYDTEEIMDLVVFDPVRPVCYIFSESSQSVSLRSLNAINEPIASCNFPGNGYALNKVDIDWHGNTMFALTTSGLALVQVGEIYPALSVDKRFAFKSDDLAVNVSNYGNTISNTELYANGKILSYTDNDTSGNTITIPNPLDNDTSGKLSASVYGYPSKPEDLVLISRLSEKVDFESERTYFVPSNMFYDEKRQDLYLLDKTLSFGKTILRFHIEKDAQTGELTVTKKTLPPFIFTLPNPIGMARVHDHLIFLNGQQRIIRLFNVDKWDHGQDPEIRNIYISQFTDIRKTLHPTGIVGYSPPNNPEIRYAYIWDSTMVLENNVFQIDLTDTLNPVLRHCPRMFAPNRTQDIYIEYDNDYLNDRAYSVFGSGNTAEIIRAFKPYATAINVMPVSSYYLYGDINIYSPYKITGNNDFFISSLITGKGVALISPLGYHFLSNQNMIPRFMTASDDFLFFSGKNDSGQWNVSFMDINYWDNHPFEDWFNVVYNYTNTQNKVNDVKVIDDNLFVTVGNDVYIMNTLHMKED